MPVSLDGLSLPAKSGVYLFKTNQGRVLYVGKATKLNQRVKSYFSRNPDRAMIPELVKQSDDIEVIITASPHEALILKKLIQLGLLYNSCKDDKSFHIGISNDERPVLYTRRPPKVLIWGYFQMFAAILKLWNDLACR